MVKVDLFNTDHYSPLRYRNGHFKCERLRTYSRRTSTGWLLKKLNFNVSAIKYCLSYFLAT